MSDEDRDLDRPAGQSGRGPRPLGGLTDLAELLGGDSQRSRKFLGGLVIGALVSAAITGGSLFRRRNRGGP